MADTRTREGGGTLPGGLDTEAADRLKSVVRDLAEAEADRLLTGLGRRLGKVTGKLNDVAEGNSPGLGELALGTGRRIADGKGPLRAAVETGGGRLKGKAVEGVKGLLDKAGGGREASGGRKPVVILEHIDVGVPVKDAYDQWTRFQDFSSFARGVQDVTVADDATSDWKAKIFWSSRSWRATTTEQIPDRRIAWTSEGAKGSTKGVVTFHELADDLTRVVLVVEYYPQGFFERTGNLWRAQGRRVRLDLKHYARHLSLRGGADEGRRGEIRDGEVVVGHEEAAAGEAGADEADEASGESGTDDAPEAEAETEPEAGPEDEPGSDPEAEAEEEPGYETDDGPGDALDDEPEDDAEDEPEGEPEDVYDEEQDEAGTGDEDELVDGDDPEPADDPEPEDEAEAEDGPEDESAPEPEDGPGPEDDDAYFEDDDAYAVAGERR
ncbi:SRPBCC family protein [Streptomyces albus]|uniref:SRPBCC family protein n=1 Tax=Streptomyces sp. NRRL F-5917 TaxID=1463873 RepID=UPI0007C45DF2|nr:SRPBCC family protein [Streptomyces sp. NRRL F-5917]